MAKLKTIMSRIISRIDGFSAYMFMVAGIIFFNNSETIKNATSFSFDIKIGQVIFSAGIALILIVRSERIPSEGEDREAAKVGRKKRYWYRMASAFTHGYAWQGMLTSIIDAYVAMGAK